MILIDLPSRCYDGSPAGRGGSGVQVGIGHSINDRDVPDGAFARAPRHKSHAVRAFPVGSGQPGWFLRRGENRTRKRTPADVVQMVVTAIPARATSARQAMKT